MTKIRFTIEDGDVPAWIHSMLEARREENASPPADPLAPRRVARKRGPMEAKVQVPRFRWSRAHAALVASGEPYAAEAADAGVLVTTTAEGRLLLEELEAAA